MNVEEIKQALAAATTGPWNFAVFEDGRHVIYDNTFLNRHLAEIVRGGVVSEQREKDNAHLIANAPTWLAQLLEERAVLVEAFKLIAMISNDENAVVTSQQTLEKVGELP